MTKNSIMTGLRVALSAMALGGSFPANAAGVTQTVTIKGSVFASPPCVINNNATINVPFGEVEIESINGSYKKVTVFYSLTCSRLANNELRMKVTGDTWWYGTNYLSVPRNRALGVAIYKDGKFLPLNRWEDFNGPGKPELQAVLEKNTTNEEVSPGAFNTSATLVVDYR